MEKRLMAWKRVILGIGGGTAVCFLLGSCAGFDKSWLPGSAASAVQNQIMLVREEPPSFGFSRLASRSKIYPDLGLFLQQRGIPDFLAEIGGTQNRHYFILYYLQERKAFACRTRPDRAQVLEFAGPYPITAREYRLLDGFRRGKGPGSARIRRDPKQFCRLGISFLNGKGGGDRLACVTVDWPP
jgi:hypothetical protein